VICYLNKASIDTSAVLNLHWSEESLHRPTRKLQSCAVQVLRNFDVFLWSRNFCSGAQFSCNFGYFCQFWSGWDTKFNCCELWLL